MGHVKILNCDTSVEFFFFKFNIGKMAYFWTVIKKKSWKNYNFTESGKKHKILHLHHNYSF